jgi:hypothetical protein
MDIPEPQAAVAVAPAYKTDVVLWKAERNWLRLASGLVVMVDKDDQLLAEYAPSGVRFIDHIPRIRPIH